MGRALPRRAMQLHLHRLLTRLMPQATSAAPPSSCIILYHIARRVNVKRSPHARAVTAAVRTWAGIITFAVLTRAQVLQCLNDQAVVMPMRVDLTARHNK